MPPKPPSRPDLPEEEKKQIAKNLYLGDLPEEVIAMQLDLEVPVVIRLLKEMNVYKKEAASA
jgi:hypothetical protein